MAYETSAQSGSSTKFASLLLKSELISQTAGGPGVEPQTAAMFNYILNNGGPATNELVAMAASLTIQNRGVSRGAAASLFRTVIIDSLSTTYGDNVFSDKDRTTVEDWQEPIDKLEQDLVSEHTDTFNKIETALIIFTAATPVRERYYNQELIAQLSRDRFPDGIRALDYGCSLFLGSLAIANKHLLPIEFENVSAEVPGRKTDDDLTAQANLILAKESLFKQIVAVDTFPFYNEGRQGFDKWAAQFALHGLRPSERNNPAYMGEIKNLMNTKDRASSKYDRNSIVKFQAADFLKREELVEFSEQYPDTFDLIMVNYVTQELNPQHRLKLHNLLCNLLSENGLLIYNHQAHIDDSVEQPAPIEAVQHYNTYATLPNRSRMHVVDRLLHPSWVQEAMSYYDNRCRIVRLGAGKLVVNGEAELIADLVRQS
ncbi:MAG TPA: hypothetical protein VLF79_04070 [Candidatus Saccharimonadales bacterium]|nr:hypothetical protein [Candidatus Saccharimonadales bacterium]